MNDNAAFGDRPSGGDHPAGSDNHQDTTQGTHSNNSGSTNASLLDNNEADPPLTIADIVMDDASSANGDGANAKPAQEAEQGTEATGQEGSDALALNDAEFSGQDGNENGDAEAGMMDFGAEEGFDPATLANLAALSRIGVGEDEGDQEMGGGGGEQDDTGDDGLGAVDFAALLPSIQEVAARAEREEQEERRQEEASSRVPSPSAQDHQTLASSIQSAHERDMSTSEPPALTSASGHERRERFDRAMSHQDHHDHDHGDSGDHDEDEDFMDSKYVYEDGRLKRKRNRTVLCVSDRSSVGSG